MTKEKTKIEDIHPMKQIAFMSVLQVLALSLMVASMFFISVLSADQMVHKFKNPSFSGTNTSSHYLTIENQEFNRKEAIKAEIKAYQDELERDAKNTTLARFIRNLESRIYAQLSRQLVENLFGENPSESGQVELEGNTIEYESDGEYITLKITDADGNETIITLPIGSFTF
jgi:curli production assembly/transport component CsgF